MFIGSSNFLEEISSLSHSIVFFYFFALIAEEGFLISPCYSLELCIQVGISSIQSPSCVWLFGTPWTAALQASLSITNFRSLLKLMSIELVMRSNHLILCRPLLLPPSIFPSMRVFSNELVLCISWPEYSNFSFNISLFKVYSRLIFFRIDWFNLLAVQGTLKSLLHHHSSKASIFTYHKIHRLNIQLHTFLVFTDTEI